MQQAMPVAEKACMVAQAVPFCCDIVYRHDWAAPLLNIDARNTSDEIEKEHQKIIKTSVMLLSTDKVCDIHHVVERALKTMLHNHSMFVFIESELVGYYPAGFSNYHPFLFDTRKRISITFRIEDQEFTAFVRHPDILFCATASPVRKYGEYTNWQHQMVVQMTIDFQWTVQEVIDTACEKMKMEPDSRESMQLCYLFRKKRTMMFDKDEKLGEFLASGNFAVHEQSYAYCARDMTMNFVLVHGR